MKNLRIVIVLFFSVLIAQPGSDVPETMSFQGLLTDSDGVAYEDGSYDLTFRLIRELTDGSDQVIWEENHSANISNGVFSVVLGYVNPLPLNISPNVQLETQVGDEVLSPRQALTSVPFALKSSRSQQAYQSVLSDTAMVALNAPLADTANFALNSNNSTSELNDLSDVFVDWESIYIGSDPSQSENYASEAEGNTSLGAGSMSSIQTGFGNVWKVVLPIHSSRVWDLKLRFR